MISLITDFRDYIVYRCCIYSYMIFTILNMWIYYDILVCFAWSDEPFFVHPTILCMRIFIENRRNLHFSRNIHRFIILLYSSVQRIFNTIFTVKISLKRFYRIHAHAMFTPRNTTAIFTVSFLLRFTLQNIMFFSTKSRKLWNMCFYTLFSI